MDTISSQTELFGGSEPSSVSRRSTTYTHNTVVTETDGGLDITFDENVTDRALNSLLTIDASELDIREENVFVSLTVFCQTWIQKAFGLNKHERPSAEKYIDTVARVVDSVADQGYDMKDLVEEKTMSVVRETVVNGKVIESTTTTKSTHKVRRGNRSLFAATLANEARVKYGPLRFTEANYIMVRKFIAKLVEENFPDLRTTDKVVALDRAAFMTLVVTEETHKMMYALDNVKRGNRILVRFGALE